VDYGINRYNAIEFAGCFDYTDLPKGSHRNLAPTINNSQDPEPAKIAMSKIEHFISSSTSNRNNVISINIMGIKNLACVPINMAKFINALSSLFINILSHNCSMYETESIVESFRLSEIIIRHTLGVIDAIYVTIDGVYYI
jgi:hypothetical protein